MFGTQTQDGWKYFLSILFEFTWGLIAFANCEYTTLIKENNMNIVEDNYYCYIRLFDKYHLSSIN